MALSWLSCHSPGSQKARASHRTQLVANRRPGVCRQKACQKGRADWGVSRSPGRTGEFLGEVQDRPPQQTSLSLGSCCVSLRLSQLGPQPASTFSDRLSQSCPSIVSPPSGSMVVTPEAESGLGGCGRSQRSRDFLAGTDCTERKQCSRRPELLCVPCHSSPAPRPVCLVPGGRCLQTQRGGRLRWDYHPGPDLGPLRKIA